MRLSEIWRYRIPDGMRKMQPCKYQALRTWLPCQIPNGINSANGLLTGFPKQNMMVGRK